MTLVLPSPTRTVFWFLGADGELALGASGVDDLGATLDALAETNAYAPAGIGGEAMFTNVYMSLFRDCTEDVTLIFTLIVDGVEEDPINLTIPGVASPARSVYEIGLSKPYPSAADPQILTAPRGQWVQLRVETSGGLPDGRFVIEGLELEREIVTEGQGAINASA